MAAAKKRRASRRRRAARPAIRRAKSRAGRAARRKRPIAKRSVKPKTAARKTKRAKATPKVRRSSPRPKKARPSPAPAAAPATRVARKTVRPPVEKPAAPHVAPVLNRERKRLPESERVGVPAVDDRLLAAARSGHDELKAALERHHETSPVLTAGDIDAKWEDAYAVGDEAPGGDNPTPDQEVVDDIGKALGVTYQDDEELKADEKIASRDRKRFELDPASADDWPRDKNE